jgi:hypothetical protein
MTCINKDRLHPSLENPWVHYVDKNKWRMDIHHYDAGPFNVPSCKQKSPKLYDDLDTLCHKEFQRRVPTRIPRMSDKKKIAFNTCRRDDLACYPRLCDQLRQKLKISDDEALESYHLLLKNSPFNGSSYFKKNTIVPIQSAITSSRDRTAENISMARSIHDAEGTSICYSGRPDSLLKAQQQGEMIFFRELFSQRKGLVEEISSSGKRLFTLTFAVTSALTTNLLTKWTYKGLNACPERKYAEEEVKAFKILKKKVFPITNPVTGELVFIRYRPILFSNQINFFGQLEDVLPETLSGRAFGRAICAQGIKKLNQYAKSRIKTLQDPEKVKLIKSLLHTLKTETAWLPEEEILCRDLLCKLLDLPIVYHCKSSTDRTAVLIALSSALHQWLSLRNELPKKFSKLLRKSSFKELFAANLMAGHQISRISRGGKGKINGGKLDPKILGLVFGSGFMQSQIITRLLPKRYLKKVGTPTVILQSILALFIPFFLAIWKIKNFHTLVPKIKLDESSPLVGKRKLLCIKD